MRLKSLTMKNFGSYFTGDKTITISFEEPKQNLFLITGDTGAGKTTIFDAIVFALFGDGKNNTQFRRRSQFAKDDQDAYVKLIFIIEEGGKEYAVTRSPGYFLKKDKWINQSALLECDKKQIYKKVNDVNNELIDIIGLDKGQFMQSAMIAQGEYMKLLTADKKDRQKILRKLFNTEIYNQITVELKDRVNGKGPKAEENENLIKEFKAKIREIKIPTGYEGNSDTIKSLKESGDSLYVSKANLNSLFKELSGICESLSQQQSELEKQYNDANQNRDDLIKNHITQLLAKENLTEGQPCPVCGSKEHPAPCNFPDESEYETDISDAEKVREDAWKKLSNIESQIDANKSACYWLKKNKNAIVEHYQNLSLTHKLYELLGGKKTGNRMDIETYVQRYYMQKIINDANKHFSEMSDGQLELGMTSIEDAGSGTGQGLDLTVFSRTSGKERDVHTLSGGESFLASLSLALGMSDQIQKSSQVKLDFLFIDEGFGSLDDFSRDQVVKVLQQEAEKGKLIGIISHVSELRQQIDDQLRVTKDKDGSHARWQIS